MVRQVMAQEAQRRRHRADGWVFGAIVLALAAYLVIAGVWGEHGLSRLATLEAEQTALTLALSGLQAERARIEDKTRRLSVDGLDLELLDARARHVLGLAHPDEILIR